MTEEIVDLLEAVEIEAEKGHCLGSIGSHCQLAFDDLLEMQAIRQLGQNVVPREKRRRASLRRRSVMSSCVEIQPPSGRRTRRTLMSRIVGHVNDARRVRRGPGRWWRQHFVPGPPRVAVLRQHEFAQILGFRAGLPKLIGIA